MPPEPPVPACANLSLASVVLPENFKLFIRSGFKPNRPSPQQVPTPLPDLLSLHAATHALATMEPKMRCGLPKFIRASCRSLAVSKQSESCTTNMRRHSTALPCATKACGTQGPPRCVRQRLLRCTLAAFTCTNVDSIERVNQLSSLLAEGMWGYTDHKPARHPCPCQAHRSALRRTQSYGYELQ